MADAKEVRTTMESLEAQFNALSEHALVTKDGDELQATLRAGTAKVELTFDAFTEYSLDDVRTQLAIHRHKADPVIHLKGAIAGSSDDEKRAKGVAQPGVKTEPGDAGKEAEGVDAQGKVTETTHEDTGTENKTEA